VITQIAQISQIYLCNLWIDLGTGVAHLFNRAFAVAWLNIDCSHRVL